MAKKKAKSNLGKILYFMAAALGVVAIVMMFVDSVKEPNIEVFGKVVEGEGYSGLKVVFGYKENDVEIFKFSFMALLPYLMVVASVVILIINMISKKSSKILDLVSVAIFVVAGVLFFCMPSFMQFADNIIGKTVSEIDFKLAIGSIVSAISSIVAGVVVLAKALLKK